MASGRLSAWPGPPRSQSRAEAVSDRAVRRAAVWKVRLKRVSGERLVGKARRADAEAGAPRRAPPVRFACATPASKRRRKKSGRLPTAPTRARGRAGAPQPGGFVQTPCEPATTCPSRSRPPVGGLRSWPRDAAVGFIGGRQVLAAAGSGVVAGHWNAARLGGNLCPQARVTPGIHD